MDKPPYWLALKKALANPGGVIALNSASVSGLYAASCGISFIADLCKKAKFGFLRPGLIYKESLGTSSQLENNISGLLKHPQMNVLFVQGSPNCQG
jgi:hypothetical protein